MEGQDLRYAGKKYSLDFPADRPYLNLLTSTGRRLASLFVLSSVHPLDGRDDTTAAGSWSEDERDGETVFTLEAQSSVWTRKVYRVRCRPERFTFDITVEGSHRLAEVLYFGGYSSARPRFGSGFFPSGQNFERGFNPEPNAENRPYFEPSSGSVIDLAGGPLP